MPSRIRSLQISSAIFLCFVVILSNAAKAELSIEYFSLTTNSVSFDISGTFPDTPPAYSARSFFFVNPNLTENPGFALGDFFHADAASFTGNQILQNSTGPIATGSASIGDYFFVAFKANFSPGESINGTVSASWSSTAFELGAVDTINAYWGTSSRAGGLTGGVFVDTLIVPEPSVGLMIGIATICLAAVRKRI